MSDVTAKFKSWLNGLQRRVERLEELMPRTEERPNSKSGSASPLVKVNADMTADDTKYDCVYLDADGTVGDTVKTKRPPGVIIGNGEKGTIVKDNDGERVFQPIHHESDAASNAVSLGTSGEGSETAAADSYDIATDRGKGLSMTLMTRMAYYDSGNQTLYGYTRTFEYDEYGHLISVSAESRVTIEVPEVCT